MLEGLAAWVLNTYLGQYLEDLNTDQLSIGLLKGEVELENVPLRKDALRHLDMALEVRSGFVGKVRLQIPVARLKSEPWNVVFEQLYLVAGPVNLSEYDDDSEKKAYISQKITQLDSIEATWRAELERRFESTSTGSSYTSWMSYGTSIITNIIENIQLKVKNVHLRYEDDQSKPGEVFACGFTIDSLTVQSSDHNWVPKFINTSDKDMSYKLLELKNLGMYIDSSTELFSNKSIGELSSAMLSSINEVNHNYILQPVSATACLKRNLSAAPLRSRSSPRFTCDLKLETFPLFLNDIQYNQLISSLRHYDRLERARPYRKWRPKCIGIKGNSSEWWQYAIQCHLDRIHKKYAGRNWHHAFETARLINKYVQVYCNFLRNSTTLGTDLKVFKMKFEEEFRFEEIRFIRERCMDMISQEISFEKPSHKNPISCNKTVMSENVPQLESNSNESTGLLQSWFPAWSGWYGVVPESEEAETIFPAYDCSDTSEDSKNSKRAGASFGHTLEEEILYVISDSIENNTFMKRDAVFAQLSFSLKQGCFVLSKMADSSLPEDKSPALSNAKIIRKRISLFELEFSNVKIAMESRPRNMAFSFNMELGSMSLKDQVTPNTAFPLIMSQQREALSLTQKFGTGRAPTLSGPSGVYARLSSMISSVSRSNQYVIPSPQQVNQEPLFSLNYERKPRNQKTEHKLVISSQAMDIVYNQIAINAICDFFSPSSFRKEEDRIMQSWSTQARKRYEELKQQTKDELKKNFETLIKGVTNMERKKWDIQLDISAPQIIIPEHFHDNNATVVVLDFGKLIFGTAPSVSNDQSHSQGKDSHSDDDDAYATPCSTPEEFSVKEEVEPKTSNMDEPNVTETNLHEHLYDKYDLRLCDLQVLVAKVRDNWRYAYQKGTSPMHVLDRFSINLHLERRILNILPGCSTDGENQWPNLILSGSLPHLVVHINEQKVQALRNMLSTFMVPMTPQQREKDFCQTNSTSNIVKSDTLTLLNNAASDDEAYDALIDQAKLIVMQFCVDKLSLELQSRGRSIAELQVTGVKAQLSKRPYDLSALLSVHSLLLVDALQTFGPDFELLVASHKHISMDSVSGSLLDSEPCSPTSPASPDPNLPCKPTSPLALSQALSSLASNRGKDFKISQCHSPMGDRVNSPCGLTSPLFGTSLTGLEGRDSEALISLELTYVSSKSPSQRDAETYLFSSLQFNSLDVIANQETIVELVGFLHQIFSSGTSIASRNDSKAHPPKVAAFDIDDNPPPHFTKNVKDEAARQSFYGSIASLYPTETLDKKSSIKTELSFDFHKLTILFLRGTLKDKELVGRKVATAVLSDAKIEASVMSDILTVEGSLGGFQIRDVSPDGNKHQCIVSVGYDPIVEKSQDLVSRLNLGVYQSFAEKLKEYSQRAFSFRVLRPIVLCSPYDENILHHSIPILQDVNSKLKIEMSLASVCYTHSPQFLSELKLCASEFKQYAAQVAQSIKLAATEMAIGLVSKRIESFVSLSSAACESSPRHTRHISTSRSTDTLVFPNPPPASTLDSHTLSPIHSVAPDLTFNIELHIVLETPIIVLPETYNSSSVLVAHLGQISISNKDSTNQENEVDDNMAFFMSRTAAFHLSVKDMSLYSLNVDERLRSRDITFHPLSTTMMCAEELYSCKDHGMPILHNSSLELVLVQKRDPELLSDSDSGLIFPADIYIDTPSSASKDSFTIDGGFVTPLKVSVSRHQYQQILKSLDNLSIPSLKKSGLTQDSKKLNTIQENENLNSQPKRSSQNSENNFNPEDAKNFISRKGTFTIPSLCVELRGDVGKKEQPLVNLVLEEITAFYEARQLYETNTQISLRSLEMEDLQLRGSCADPGHHFLMKSETKVLPSFDLPKSCPQEIPPQGMQLNSQFISSSCPELGPSQYIDHLSSSLPSKLEMEKPFYDALRKPSNLHNYKKPSIIVTKLMDPVPSCLKHKCPSTPPPSPNPKVDSNPDDLTKNGALVNISIHTVDEKSHDFLSKYYGTHRFINVDFNRLVTVFNLESWVMVFDFFRTSSGEAVEKWDFENKSADHLPESVNLFSDSADEINTVMEIKVHCLTLVLNKIDEELAKASISEVFIRSVGSEGNLTLSGKLGSLSLTDCTSYGNLYDIKFVTVGSEAMTFQLFRYSQDDPYLNRDCDIRLKLKMSSIMYIHSQRFIVELMQFFQQFILFREIVSDWRATSAGLKVTGKAHGTRVSMAIDADSPVIFIPMSNYSESLLGADLGSLSISNKFLFSGTSGTISQVRREDLFDRLSSTSNQGVRSRSGSFRSRSRSGNRRRFAESSYGSSEAIGRPAKCLLDVMQVNLVNMDLFTCLRYSGSSSFELPRIDPQPIASRDESEDSITWHFGPFKIERKGLSLLKDKCALKVQVERNLDGDICRIVPDFSIHGNLNKVHATVDVSVYKLIRGLLAYNLGEQIQELTLTPSFLALQEAANRERIVHFTNSHIWTTLNIHFDLDNVIIEAEINKEVSLQTEPQTVPFACINLIKSRLTYESFSDSSNDVDLVSQEILISDMRFRDCPANKRTNVFTNILQPAQDQVLKNENPLQAEVHFRSTKEITKFTILLNNMRMMAILDWWKEALAFIESSPPRPPKSDGPENRITKSLGVSAISSLSPSPRSLSPCPTVPVNSSNLLCRTISSPPRLNPMVESTGLMTKHALLADNFQIPFELKLNITDSELVLVENSRMWDTAAIILKTTAVISFRPQFNERPISCNLNQCEIYSCTLDMEEDTALNIIDPVTINIEVNDHSTKNSALDISNIMSQNVHIVEITLHQLNIRLSYHDMKLFQKILESLPRQHEEASSRKNSKVLSVKSDEFGKDKQPANIKAQVEKLAVLGFSKEDCLTSLKECSGRLDEAALWLLLNAQPPPSIDLVKTSSSFDKSSAIDIQGIELKTGSVNLCIIDDCGDCDVPLFDVCFSRLGLKQNCDWKGSASCSLIVDYYNRALSGWEPFIEPWQCDLKWSKSCSIGNKGKFDMSLKSEGTVNVTVTSTLLDLCYLVKNNWTNDYITRERSESEFPVGKSLTHKKKESTGSPQGYRRRIPFVPFALKNDTGCDLSFVPLAITNSSESQEIVVDDISESQWKNLTPGDIATFSFEEKTGKHRHRNTHDLKSHRILVRVGDWSPVGPVTVDKVGVFFRIGLHQQPNAATEMPSVRIVFAITMDGLARKLITVRSALLLTNHLPHPIEVKLENMALRFGDLRTMRVPARMTVAVPLLYVWARTYIKPLKGEKDIGSTGWIYCREPIHWKTLLLPNETTCDRRCCDPVHANKPSYRFIVYVRRDNYPVDSASGFKSSSLDLARGNFGEYSRQRQDWIQPGHSIILVSPLTFVNLLPFDLHYEVKSSADKGRVKPGQEAFLSSVNPEEELEILLWTDSFHAGSPIVIRSSNSPYTASYRLNDSSGRSVLIQLKVFTQYGKALKINVSAYYWLINKTGIPLIFKQEGTNSEAAGQDEEHEVARCATPLLFAFTDPEASPMLVARVGKNLHRSAMPHYCKKFPLTQGTCVRRLKVNPNDHRPDFVYMVGVDVRTGKGRYRDTYMVTLSPRFHIENRSSHELLISQQCFTSSSVDSGSQTTWLRAIPGCWLPFHWPRLDKDQLLCVLLCDISYCHWSGGFLVDKTDSFNINIRDNLGHSYFLRVEILMNDATFFVVFTDADSLPPPFRIDNFSEVPITYFQTGTQEGRMRSIVKAKSCVPYAWDEITLKPYITCIAPGGTSATYNLNVLEDGARLTYENFIYIAFTGSFRSNSKSQNLYDTGTHSEKEQLSTVDLESSSIDCLQLVLDVTEGSRVTLARKELGRRSQLWRMTSERKLQHEGSSPPYDPASKKPRGDSNILVLDIAGDAPLPTEYTPLMLRKPDKRRRMTQTWRFTEEGRLCCEFANLFVQAKDGFCGLSSGNDVVVGPPQAVHYASMSNGIPIEQAICRQHLRPGSGTLAIKVSTDGPTRVLQVTDAKNKNDKHVARTENGDFLYINDSGMSITKSAAVKQINTSDSNFEELQLQIVLKGGIGLSVVSSPEELVYVLLSDIILDCQSSAKHRMLDCSIKDIQVDNQLTFGQCPVVLYVSAQSKYDESRHLPAIQISAHQLKFPNLNAYIFKHLMVTIKSLTLTIEEALLFKILILLGLGKSENELENVEESQYETKRLLTAATSANATRYYFTHLKLVLDQIRLSVYKSKNSTPDLRAMRRKLGLTLVQFENALVSLDPFIREHPFETWQCLLDNINSHYESELLSQAMRILGSTDFLGNPFGLLADVSEGVQELVRGGSVGGLVLNVTHGMANSTAKVTGSLSEAVGRVMMDRKHEAQRHRLLTRPMGQNQDHFVSGLMGFGLGLYGGLTSIFAQTYNGTQKEGLPGFFSGFAKGVVGTVTKPAIGFLDLASGTASAVRDTSKNPSHKLPLKSRKPRVVVGINGMMPRYSEKHVAGQELLRFFNHNSTEIYFGYEILRQGEDDLRVLISSEQILVFSWADTTEQPTAVLSLEFRDLYQCRRTMLGIESGAENPRHYIELTMKAETSEVLGNQLSSPFSSVPSQLMTKRPKVRCDTAEIANKVAQQINFARNLHDELRHTLPEAEEEMSDVQ